MNLFSRLSPRFRMFFGIASVAAVLDQLSKYWAVGALTTAYDAAHDSFFARLHNFLWTEHPSRKPPIAVVDNFFHFRYAENPGAAWSFLATAPDWFRSPFFLSISVAAMIFIVVYYRKTADNQLYLRLALSLVFGGAIGNFLDRLRLGYVIDFIDWHWYDKFTWPTFNVADSAISLGVGLMVLDMLTTKSTSQPNPQASHS